MRQRAALLDVVPEALSLEQLHHDEAVAIRGLPEVLHVDDVLVAEAGGSYQLQLAPVAVPGEEYISFFQPTPDATLQLAISNPGAGLLEAFGCIA